MSLSKTTKSYSYRSVGGGGNADINIEYASDLSALSRLEVSEKYSSIFINVTFRNFNDTTYSPNLHDIDKVTPWFTTSLPSVYLQNSRHST